tara:strand:+ start:2421 stop:3068 length:648 start_codon:yes stop_codon:yes gene_type:complete
MSFTNSTFTLINCQNPSKRFELNNDEIRQMELKINLAYKRAGNWEHIANHLYNFYTKIGMIGQPKSNRNVYPNEYNELLKLYSKSYEEVLHQDRLEQSENVYQRLDKPRNRRRNKAITKMAKQEARWEKYTSNYVSNADDNISNPSLRSNKYTNNLAEKMKRKLNVNTSSEYVTSAQLHMNDRFRDDVTVTKDSSAPSEENEEEESLKLKSVVTS